MQRGRGSRTQSRTLARLSRLSAALSIAFLAGACTENSQETPTAEEGGSKPAFVDVAREAGITHTHHKPVLDAKLSNIMSWMASVGAAVASVDYDRDGWMDLYFTDSRKGEPNRLYRNQGDGTFRDVGPAAGVADVNGEDGTSMDAAFADYDGDGWPDLYLVRWGHDALFRNRGDGTFEEVTTALFEGRDATPGMEWANGNAVLFLDYDLDGRLDIYVGNYFQPVDLWHLENTLVMHESFETARNGGANFLFHQEADGRFREVAGELGVDDVGWTLAVGSADLDNDGWPDLYCADDFGPDQLYLNDRDGGFRNATEAAIGFDTKKGMNVDFGDFNNDGWLDIFVANITTAEYLQEGGMLWHNNGPSADGQVTLTDIALEAGTYDGGWGWGAKFLDYDNDGDLDIVAANGFISAGEGSYWYDLASWTVVGDDPTDSRNWPDIGDRSFSGFERMRLWRNDGLDSFTERGRELGLTSTRDGRGVATLDYDNDGDLDIFIANQGQAPHLYRNDGDGLGHWLMVALEADAEATGVNRDALGARVTLVRGDGGRMIREREGGNGYSGQSDPRLHFGLGADESIALLEVRWPDGGVQYLENVAADQRLVIRQDPTRYAAKVRLDVLRPSPARVSGAAPSPRPEIAPEELERQLGEAERGLEGQERGWAPASSYRRLAAGYGEHDRAIRFFERLVDEQGGPSARIELAAAYVDKIPTCGGLATVVCKGSLARKGLLQLDEVLEHDPESWLALYARGMNHLHWPRALRHSWDAVGDLQKCIALQEQSGERQAYHLAPHIALGDAYAKAGDYAAARRAWQRALEIFSGESELEKRLAISDDAGLLDYVEDVRSLERPIDTDLAFYTESRGAGNPERPR
ncbi:MAG: CRTAC1 family protein [Deltaproteobacteria bacterium]|nr:CRTAC1 family protein [Deltaproteobacteria bacterium]MBW2419989.1 CRTAC1 family protein [Deltaproteobacteria bacterium]